jgi:hypothetical protein
MHTNTIIAAPLEGRHGIAPMLVEQPRIDLLPDGNRLPRQFKIRAADSYVRRASANNLIRHRYAWRGYHVVSLPEDQTANRITLTASEEEQTIGTITIGLDCADGLACEDIFGDKIGGLRADGQRICEFTKLAIDPLAGTKRVLAALFHVAYIVAHRLRGYDTLVMEVNPRHVRYYERMLGARVLCEERLNRSVNAQAVLLVIDFDYIRQQIGEFAGQPERSNNERSLYPFAFSLAEEAGIIGRMMKAQRPASMSVN